MEQLAFFIDVDNTLLDNDGAKEDQNQHLQRLIGADLAQRYWNIYEQVRKDRGVVDIPLAISRFRDNTAFTEVSEKVYFDVVRLFMEYPFKQVVFPDVPEMLAQLKHIGNPVIVSDGDPLYQALKIMHSGLSAAFEDQVLIYTHKQKHLQEVTNLYPAEHYVLVDDRADILADSRNILGERLCTVFVRQGKYSRVQPSQGFTPDITIENIADLRRYSAEQFMSSKQTRG